MRNLLKKTLTLLLIAQILFGSTSAFANGGVQCQKIFKPSLDTIRLIDQWASTPVAGGNRVGDAIDAFIDLFLFPFKKNKNTALPPVQEPTFFEGSSLATAYFELASHNKLINQMDPRLLNHNLLVPNGGLCASACAANLLGAAILLNSNKSPRDFQFDFYSPQFIDAVVQIYGKQLNKSFDESWDGQLLGSLLRALLPELTDARYGANGDILLEGLQSTFRGLGVNLIRGIYLNEKNLLDSTRRGVMFSTVEVLNVNGAPIHGVHSLHAIVILKMDSVNQLITYSDPNNPNVIQTKSYVVDTNGEVYFPSQVHYGQGPNFFRLTRSHHLEMRPALDLAN
ncbi:MAG: hypothetical protein KDD33_13420 [Bdellovibrionales bacterium]|nr:hypothetical protein [Bdellovibrionales bacterium]